MKKELVEQASKVLVIFWMRFVNSKTLIKVIGKANVSSQFNSNHGIRFKNRCNSTAEYLANYLFYGNLKLKSRLGRPTLAPFVEDQLKVIRNIQFSG